MTGDLVDLSRSLRHELLLRLGDRLKRDRPELVGYASRGPRSFVLADWAALVGAVPYPEPRFLTAIHDLDLGLDALRCTVESALAATNARIWFTASGNVSVRYAGVLERTQDLAKVGRRLHVVPAALADEIIEAIEARADAPILKFRHEVAHSAQRPESVVTSAVRARLWELIALSGQNPRPLESTYTFKDADMAEWTTRHQAGLADVESLVTGYYARIETALP
jgi:hypothetical protein